MAHGTQHTAYRAQYKAHQHTANSTQQHTAHSTQQHSSTQKHTAHIEHIGDTQHTATADSTQHNVCFVSAL